MTFQVHKTIDIKELPSFFTDINKLIKDIKTDIMDEFQKDSWAYSHKITRQRLPSGGGSYGRMIKWRNIQRDKHAFISELFNNHQYAVGVERGTPEHKIKSNFLMRANPVLRTPRRNNPPYGTKYKKGELRAYEFDHPGARAFNIFGDTEKYINKRSNRIVDNVFKKHGVK